MIDKIFFSFFALKKKNEVKKFETVIACITCLID